MQSNLLFLVDIYIVGSKGRLPRPLDEGVATAVGRRVVDILRRQTRGFLATINSNPRINLPPAYVEGCLFNKPLFITAWHCVNSSCAVTTQHRKVFWNLKGDRSVVLNAPWLRLGVDNSYCV